MSHGNYVPVTSQELIDLNLDDLRVVFNALAEFLTDHLSDVEHSSAEAAQDRAGTVIREGFNVLILGFRDVLLADYPAGAVTVQEWETLTKIEWMRMVCGLQRYLRQSQEENGSDGSDALARLWAVMRPVVDELTINRE